MFNLLKRIFITSFLNLGIKLKLSIVLFIVTLLSISITGFYGYDNAAKAYIKKAYESSVYEIKMLSVEMERYLEATPKDIVFLANLLSLERYLNWQAVGEHSKMDEWLKETVKIFYSIMESKDNIHSVFYIDEKGEMQIKLKQNPDSGKISVGLDSYYDGYLKDPFFAKTMELKKDDVFISDIQLYLEKGRHSKAVLPVVRYATPVVDKNNTKRGCLVINVFADNILNALQHEDRPVDLISGQTQKYIYMVNKEGRYLYHHDERKLWSTQFEHSASVAKDFPELHSFMSDRSSGTFTENGLITSFIRLYPQISDKTNYWILFSQSYEEDILSNLRHFKYVFVVILFFVLITLGVVIKLFIGSLIPPLLYVTHHLKHLAQGEIIDARYEYNAKDEIGDIIDSTDKLVKNIKLTIEQADAVARRDFSKDVVVMSQNDHLGNALSNMKKSLKNVTSVIQAVSRGDLNNTVEITGESDVLGQSINNMVVNLREVAEVAQTIAKGNFSYDYEIRSEDDSLGYALYQMVKTLRDVVKQANAIAAGEFHVVSGPMSEQDELGTALMVMTGKLRDSFNYNEEQNWIKDGLNGLNEELAGNSNVAELGFNGLKFIASYTDSAVGAFYLYDADGEELIQHSSFAFVEREELSDRFKLGEGVVGQVGLQKSPILLKNITRTQSVISTGTTSEPPLNTYTFPLLYEGNLYGVVELGSHEAFSKIAMEFINNANGIFASFLFAAMQTGRVKALLEESEQRADELGRSTQELEQANAQMEQQQQELEAQAEELRDRNQSLTTARFEIDKKAKELETTNKFKSEFLANMSHELRTPLNSIILLSKLLIQNKNGNMTPEDIKKMEVIHSSGNELLRLIGDILDLSKIESGKVSLNINTFSSSMFVENLKELFFDMAQEKGLEYSAKDYLNVDLTTDEEKLSQVIKNLLSNAFKFTEDGSVSLEIRKNDDPDLPVEILVADTGIGIDSEKLSVIFEAFQQANGSTSRTHGGTGLGLSISKDYVKLLQGKIKVHSEEGFGSVFSVLIPFKIDANNIEADNLQQTLPVEENKTGQLDKKIKDDRNNIEAGDKVLLVIEDDLVFLGVLCDEVRDHGFKVLATSSGKEGLDLAFEYLPAGILLDLGLPEMGGVELLRHLKADASTKHIPVQILSGWEKDFSLEKLGAIGFTKKPVTHEDIKDVVERLISFSEKYPKELLVVEEDDEQRADIVELLNEDYIDITGVASVKDAIEELKKEVYDAMIVDLSVSDGCGFEVCRFIRDKNLGIPIVIYTDRELSIDEKKEFEIFSTSIVAKSNNSFLRLKEEIVQFLNKLNRSCKLNKPRTDLSQRHLEGNTILIVDDDSKNIFVMSSTLEDFGAETIVALNGQSAIETLRKNADIDLVLMDIMMPVMDGYEAIREIRKDIDLRHLPIIALTAKAMKNDRDKCMEAGADDYISKPVDFDVLMRLISAWIDKKKESLL